MSAPPLGSEADQILLVSHGYEVIYERGFCNGVADAGVCFTLIGSDRTDVPQLQPAVIVVKLRGSQAPQRSRLGELVTLLRKLARLAWYAMSQRQVLHVFKLIHVPLLAGIVQGFLIRWLTPRNTLATRELRPHESQSAWQRWGSPLSTGLVNTLLLAFHGLALPLQLRIGGACPYPELTRALRAAIAAHLGPTHTSRGSHRGKGVETRALFARAGVKVLAHG